MRTVIEAITGEYARYRDLAERTVARLDHAQRARRFGDGSVDMYLTHMGGNLRSRFTDFLGSDGEKPDRDRDGEFDFERIAPDKALRLWNEGWDTLQATLGTLTDADLAKTVRVRGIELTVSEALTRSVAHAAYHVGQIVLLGKEMLGEAWQSLSIPRDGSNAYNQSPSLEKPRGR